MYKKNHDELAMRASRPDLLREAALIDGMWYQASDRHRKIAVDDAASGVVDGMISSEVIPFSSSKESDMGREGFKYGIGNYLEIKASVIFKTPGIGLSEIRQ